MINTKAEFFQYINKSISTKYFQCWYYNIPGMNGLIKLLLKGHRWYCHLVVVPVRKLDMKTFRSSIYNEFLIWQVINLFLCKWCPINMNANLLWYLCNTIDYRGNSVSEHIWKFMLSNTTILNHIMKQGCNQLLFIGKAKIDQNESCSH